MPLRVLIADDEPVARGGLRRMLAAYDWLSVVAEAASGPAAVEAINTQRPDLVFLDVQMPGLLGTEVLQRIAEQPRVVFTTAYAQHAVTAFELGALDYLLKPFGPERLGTTLERVRTFFATQPPGTGEPGSSFERLREALAEGPLRRLFVRSGGAILPLQVSEVSWFEARGDYVAAHAGGATHLLHLSLNHLEARLDPGRFVRIHRTHIVNLDRVKGFRRGAKGALLAELSDGTRLPVSRARASELRRLGA